MWKYFLVVFVFLYHARGQALPQKEFVPNFSSLLGNLPLLLQNETDPDNSTGECNAVVVKITGQNNINAGTQIVNIHVEQTIVATVNVANYTVTPGIGAHKLHTDGLTWNDARHTCVQEGAHLAVINSDYEEAILLRMLRDSGVDAAWLGLHDLYKNGDWVTVTDKPLKNTGYSKWAAKRVDGFDRDANRQNCATLITEGGMDNERCDVTIPFFCKISV